MPTGGRRTLPRFEVIQINARRYCAYDHLTHVAHWGAYPSSLPATRAIVDMLTKEAEDKGQEVMLLREENPPVKVRDERSRSKKPKPIA